MKKFLLKVKNDLFAYSFLFLFIFLFILFILYLFNIRFRLWFIILILIIFLLSLIAGIIQIAIKESQVVKIVIILLIGSFILFCLLFYKIFLDIFSFFLCPEYVTTLDGKKYVAVVVQGLGETDIAYYDYYGLFLMGTNEKVHGQGDYNPYTYDGMNDIHLIYFDDSGKRIFEKDVTYNNGKVIDEKDYGNYDVEIDFKAIDDNVLYEVKFGKTVIRIRKTDDVMPQNMAVSVYKSTDKGKNFQCISDSIIVSQEAKFIFLDENIGFIISSGNIWLNKTSKDLYVTTDGGKTFDVSKINYKNEDVEYMSVVDFPYFEEDILHLECSIYTLNDKRDGYKDVKLDFISEDNGLTWNLN